MGFKPLIVSVYRVPQMQGVGHADVILYFKCPTTKQMRYPVKAYGNLDVSRRWMGCGSPLCEMAVNTSFQGNEARVRCYSETIRV